MTEKKNLSINDKAKNAKTEKNQVVKLPTLDELQKENREMKKQLKELLKAIENKPKSIDEQIKYFEQKKERINNLRKFEETQTEIDEVLDTLTANQEEGIFSNEHFRLVFGHKKSYNDEVGTSIVSISNTDLIKTFVEDLQKAIKIKIEELKKEISL